MGQTLPLDLQFRDEAGATVPLKSFFDGKRPVIVSLAYYSCPNLCGLLLNGLVGGLRNLEWSAGEQFTYVNISIDPREQPTLAAEKRKNYLDTYGRLGAEKGWHFLVGDEPNIRALADAIGFRYRYDEEQKQYAHAAAIYVATPDGRLSRYLYGIDFQVRDLKLALMEATNGKVGGIADRLLMFCYRYDPKTRKYALFATRLMRAGGAITVIGIAAMIFRMRRNGRG
ncbi:MAG: SCO family protein [Deltaproteobacteria bacterium]|nr:SCO family protein [Deltaproteobacteria bacterium]